MWPRCHPAAHRSLERSAVVRKCMLLHTLAQPLGESHRRIENGSRKKKQKFLPSVTPDPVDLARFCLEDRGELLQNVVAHLVAVGVVDLLEMVDVAHHARDRL